MTVQPGGRLPAPPHLGSLQDLLNTVNLESGEDELAPGAFGAWSALRGADDADEADRRRLSAFREDLRTWVASRDAQVPAAVAAGIEAARLLVSVVDGELRTTSGSAYGRLVADVVEGIRVARREGDWKRFKVCRRGTCCWAFYDHSRNNSSRWCASSICGAREKSRRAYRRRVQPADVR
ncbi:MAG: CGNR zinc finger domain-containing protein [Janthinobacterium lividum]